MSRRTALALAAAALATPALGARAATPSVPTRGFALPDWLRSDSRPPATAVLADLRDRGFETIRLPLDPGFVVPASLPAIESALATATGLGFKAILDLHPGDIDADMAEACWRLLAPLVGDTDPARVYVELLNEPQFEPAAWRSLRDRLATVVRARAPQHTLIWGPARVQGAWELDDTGPLADTNSIVSVHYYTPMLFTHQGETWYASPLARVHGLPFPLAPGMPEVTALEATLDAADRGWLHGELKYTWNAASIARDLTGAAAWARRHGTPAMLGEFGVLGFAANPVSRARWSRDVRRAAEANGMGWCWWEADQGFGFIADRTTGGVDTGIVEALLA